MTSKNIDKLIHKHCKFIIREPSKERARVIFGTLEGIDYDAGLIIIKSNPNLLSLNLNSLVAIRPKS